jgi:PepSY-associated transmembrane protein
MHYAIPNDSDLCRPKVPARSPLAFAPHDVATMMSGLILLHRWLGIAFCLLFAMWFATGIVMHFVPFPSLTETERFAGLKPIEMASVAYGPSEAVKASGITDVKRVRLVQRSDGPVFVISGGSRARSISAVNAADAAVVSPASALAIATDYGRQRGLDVGRASSLERLEDDQWSVPNNFDTHRPLFRVALNDEAGTELYVSSVTGEVVLDTTRSERRWNYIGSVAHWIYPTILRRNPSLWDEVVWTLSLLAMIAAAIGAVIGITRLDIKRGRLGSPYRGWHALHHVLGLISMVFVLTWIFSGWLSMDSGRLFSRENLTRAEASVIAGDLDWNALPALDRVHMPAQVREVEWFGLNGSFYRRDRTGLDTQVLTRIGEVGQSAFLTPRQTGAAVARLASACNAPTIVATDDDYAIAATMPGTPVYRSVCADVWFDMDSASGLVLQRLDASRRAYRWLYGALHTLDFPILASHPHVRSAVIVGLCACGFLFSVTGVVIGWRRLRFLTRDVARRA